ncbi:hypothetical protein DFH06DRAFT_1293825 [Mycena polygramma]|nr:hypothetical protein DFH06DRAFT_1293825 [Mycena polygramma]
MRIPFPSRWRRPSFPSAKRKPKSQESSSSRSSAVPDLLSTSLIALKESADAFPPLKGAVGSLSHGDGRVLDIVRDIAQRAKRSKSAAHDIALRTQVVLNVISDAVTDPFAIPSPMLRSIERLTEYADSAHDNPRLSMDKLKLTSGFSRLIHLNRNERQLRDIKTKLDDAYRDFMAASAPRVETQQAKIAAQQSQLVIQQTTFTKQQEHTHFIVESVASAIVCPMKL